MAHRGTGSRLSDPVFFQTKVEKKKKKKKRSGRRKREEKVKQTRAGCKQTIPSQKESTLMDATVQPAEDAALWERGSS